MKFTDRFFDASLMFRPRALQAPRITRETHWVDMTMPPRNWAAYDKPAIERKGKPRVNVAKLRIERARKEKEIPAFLLRQAS